MINKKEKQVAKNIAPVAKETLEKPLKQKKHNNGKKRKSKIKNFNLSVTSNKYCKTIIIKETNKLSILRDIVSCSIILVCVFCTYINFKFCGNSTLLQLFLICICFFGAFSFFKKDIKINGKQELMEFFDKNID